MPQCQKWRAPLPSCAGGAGVEAGQDDERQAAENSGCGVAGAKPRARRRRRACDEVVGAQAADAGAAGGVPLEGRHLGPIVNVPAGTIARERRRHAIGRSKKSVNALSLRIDLAQAKRRNCTGRRLAGSTAEFLGASAATARAEPVCIHPGLSPARYGGLRSRHCAQEHLRQRILRRCRHRASSRVIKTALIPPFASPQTPARPGAPTNS